MATTVLKLPLEGRHIDIACKRGETFAKTLRWKTGKYTPVDLTGWTGEMWVKTPDGSETLLTLIDGAGLVLGGAEGTIAITITAAQTSGFPVKNLPYDLRLTAPDGVRKRIIAYGQLEIKNSTAP